MLNIIQIAKTFLTLRKILPHHQHQNISKCTKDFYNIFEVRHTQQVMPSHLMPHSQTDQ